MNIHRARTLSASDAVAWALGFLRREWRLAAPIALAFLVLPVVGVQLLVPAAQPQQVRTDGVAMGAMLVWMAPVLLVGLFGGLALTALSVRPGGTVGEAIATAARRYAVLLGALGIVFAALVAALSLFSLVGVVAGAAEASLSRIGQVAVVAAMLVAGARLLPLLPVVIVEPVGPVMALRRAFALSRHNFLRLLGLALLMLVVALFVTVIAQQTIGVVFLLAGAASGQAELFAAVGTLLLGMIGGAVSATCYVVVAGVYRQLAG